MKHLVNLCSFENGENTHLKIERNLHVFNDVIDEKHNGGTLSRSMLIDQSTCTVFTNNELRTGYKCIQILNHYHRTVYYFRCHTAPSWPVMSCQTSGCRCSSELLLHAASGPPRGLDTDYLTPVASGHPNKLWKYFSGWHGLTPYLSYLRRKIVAFKIKLYCIIHFP